MAQPLAYGYDGNRKYSAIYAHSGKVTFRGTAAAAVSGVLAAILLGVVYGYADLYSPIIHLNILLCGGFGLVLGMIVAGALRWGKVRNVPVALALVGVITLAGYYVCWAAWIMAVLQRSNSNAPITLPQLLCRPNIMWSLAKAINEVGTWTMSSATSSNRQNEHGPVLWVMWVGEAVLIFAARFSS